MGASGAVRTCVGVVVPVHGTERWVGETLASVRAQTHEDWVCVVVDDGSPDGAAAVVQRVADEDERVVLVRQENAGVSAARNAGLLALPPEAALVVFVDSDDVWEPDALQALLAALAPRPDAAGATATAELCDEDGLPVEPGAHPLRMRSRLVARRGRLALLEPDRDTDFASLAVAGRIFPPAVALLRRDVVERVGGFATDLVVSEDWHLFARVAAHGPLVFLDRPVARYRRHGASATAQDPARTTHFNDVVRRRLFDGAADDEQRRVVVAAWRAVQRAALLRAARRLVPELLHLRAGTARWRARPVLELARTLPRRSPPRPDPARAHLRQAMVEVVQPGAVRRRGAAQRRTPS